MSFINNYEKEQRTFASIKEILEKQLDCKIMAVEKNHPLDLNNGIDYFLCFKNKDSYGLSSRINFFKPNFNHVTIRYKRANGSETEYAKRIKSVLDNHGQLVPKFQIQIDFDEKRKKMINFILFETVPFYSKLKEKINEIKMDKCREGNKYIKLGIDFFEKNKIAYTRINGKFNP